jgi:hypothetical protein
MTIKKVESKPVFLEFSLVSKCPYCGQGFDAVVSDCNHPTKLRPEPPKKKKPV